MCYFGTTKVRNIAEYKPNLILLLVVHSFYNLEHAELDSKLLNIDLADGILTYQGYFQKKKMLWLVTKT